MASLLQIMATILVRYLYIFYPGFMNETSDGKIVCVTRCFVGLGALVSAFLKDYANGPEYRYLTQTTSNALQEEAPTFWLFRVVLIANLLLLIITQVRIEMFKKQTNPSESNINLNRRKPRNKQAWIQTCLTCLTPKYWPKRPEQKHFSPNMCVFLAFCSSFCL